MANEKSYAKFIDIPDGNGGTERKWLEDEEARAALPNKANINHNHDTRYYTKTEVDTAISNARGVFDGTTLVL